MSSNRRSFTPRPPLKTATLSWGCLGPCCPTASRTTSTSTGPAAPSTAPGSAASWGCSRPPPPSGMGSATPRSSWPGASAATSRPRCCSTSWGSSATRASPGASTP
ncbi:hypothetical protein FOCC_FOCC000863, partial [Frankliniella occidentalis]